MQFFVILWLKNEMICLYKYFIIFSTKHTGIKKKGIVEMNYKISMKEKLCYGIGSGGGNIITQFLGAFLMAYYTDSAGIAAAAVGTMMLITRLLDGVTDIVMGGIVDKTETRWGKTRPWIFISAPFVFVGLILMFNIPEQFSQTAKIIYMYITYIFLNCIIYTMYMISHTALLSRITLDTNERQAMTAINQICNNVVQLIITGFTILFVNASGWRTVSIVYGIITALTFLICFYGTKERVTVVETDSESGHKKEKTSFKQSLLTLLRNKYFYLVTIIFILMLMIASGHGSVTYYYCNIILEDSNMMSLLSFAQTIPVILINFFVPTIRKKLGYQKMMLSGAGVMCIGFLIMSLGTHSVICAVIGTLFYGFGSGPIFAGVFALSAQVVDYGEWKYNVRSEGLTNSCVSFGSKIGLGLGSAAGSWIIAAGGYIGTAAVQTESAKNAITFAFGWFSLILAALLLVTALFLNIDKYEDQIRVDLEKKHNGNQ